MPIAVLALARAAGHLLHERDLETGHPVELTFEVLKIGELCHPVGSRSQLARSLRTAQQQDRN